MGVHRRLSEADAKLLERALHVELEDPVDVCTCGCGCEPDGDWHWSQRPWCPCLSAGCFCITDEERRAQLIAYPGD